MRPPRPDIPVPFISPATTWIGEKPIAVERITAKGPLLVHFIDPGHLSSVRTIPYLNEWRRRYSEHGLTVLGVCSPRYLFSAEPETLAPALERAGVELPVACDRDYAIWRDYGCRGWPSLFLWGIGGALRWYHFGEGAYDETERAIGRLLPRPLATGAVGEPMEPLRPSDAPGAKVMPPTEEIFPGGSPKAPLEGGPRGVIHAVSYDGAGAHATADGEGALAVSEDGAEHQVAIEGPGLYGLSAHSRHGAHRLSVRVGPGARLHALSFAPGLP